MGSFPVIFRDILYPIAALLSSGQKAPTAGGGAGSLQKDENCAILVAKIKKKPRL